jgi:hypothetical protein
MRLVPVPAQMWAESRRRNRPSPAQMSAESRRRCRPWAVQVLRMGVGGAVGIVVFGLVGARGCE